MLPTAPRRRPPRSRSRRMPTHDCAGRRSPDGRPWRPRGAGSLRSSLGTCVRSDRLLRAVTGLAPPHASTRRAATVVIVHRIQHRRRASWQDGAGGRRRTVADEAGGGRGRWRREDPLDEDGAARYHGSQPGWVGKVRACLTGSHPLIGTRVGISRPSLAVWRVAGPARVSSPGARPWPPHHALPSSGSSTGRVRSLVSGTRPRGSRWSGSHPRHTAATARAGSSPATAAGTGCFAPSGGPATRTSKRAAHEETGSASTGPG